MFGMGFMEIFLVLMVGIIALGPEKLPSAVVDIAKFFKKFKNSIDNAKSALDTELKISDMKQQANDFKASISDVTNTVRADLGSINSDRIMEDINMDNKPKEKIAIPQKKIKKRKKKKEKNITNTEEA